MQGNLHIFCARFFSFVKFVSKIVAQFMPKNFSRSRKMLIFVIYKQYKITYIIMKQIKSTKYSLRNIILQAMHQNDGILSDYQICKRELAPKVTDLYEILDMLIDEGTIEHDSAKMEYQLVEGAEFITTKKLKNIPFFVKDPEFIGKLTYVLDSNGNIVENSNEFVENLWYYHQSKEILNNFINDLGNDEETF